MLQITVEQIEKALEALEQGQVILFPTETSYGLGCDATNAQAVQRIFDMKGRSSAKGLPVLIASVEAAAMEIDFSDRARKLAEHYWPGALNIIGPIARTSTITDACHESGTQSVRMSSHPFTATLMRRFGKPLTATSANISGQDGMYSVQNAEALFAEQPDRPDVVIDAGVLPGQLASTTVVVADDHVEVIRQGSLVIDET